MTNTASNAKAIMVAIVLSMTLLGCDNGGEETLETAVRGHKIGMSTDQWLEQYSRGRHEWDKTALVFGFGDDYVGCEAMAVLLVQQFPDAQYRCVPAN
jgi:hypothetical protein